MFSKNTQRFLVGRSVSHRNFFYGSLYNPHVREKSWGVAWDIDRTLTDINSYQYLEYYARHRFISLEEMRKITKEDGWLKEILNLSQVEHIRSITNAGGKNCIITANPFIHFPRVLLEELGFTAEEIARIPVFRSSHFWTKKSFAMKRAMLSLEISDSVKLALIDNNLDIIDDALHWGHPAFYSRTLDTYYNGGYHTLSEFIANNSKPQEQISAQHKMRL